MKKYFLCLAIVFSFNLLLGQIVSLSPSNVGADDTATLRFDASQGNGELVGASKVYMHHGVVTDSPTGTDWQYVIGDWGQDNGVGEMTPVAGMNDVWEIAFTPSIRDYFGVPNGENIFRISSVFRSADGNTKGTINPGNYGWGTVTSNFDIYINLNAGNFVSFIEPVINQAYVNLGEQVTFSAIASSDVTDMRLLIDDGSGFVEVANVSSGMSINYNYSPTMTGVIDVKVTATINGEDLEAVRQQNIIVIQAPTVEVLPANMIPGINYDDNDDTKATLVLEAPGKAFAYFVGDLSNWNVLDTYQMKKTPDGEFFWIEINGLVPQEEYVFQYWVEESVKIGDPYAEKIADPWNDPWIESSTYPDLPFYDKTENGMASVLQTGQTAYQWASSESTWQRPDVDHVVIYELLIRDFIGAHDYTTLIDTLSYIKNLGVDAIEIMPFNEFEGNESWGYNPAYYFAPDKYYGPEEDLKLFIETAHQMGMAVIMDVVMNHAYGQNPMVQLYFEGGNPALDNPWFNREYVGQYQWGYDWNHESDYTKRFLDRLNAFWIEEYHIDGYRFDFTKGFTNSAPGGSVDGFDQSRIDLLERMADEIWTVDPECYIILEHWAPFNEEQILGDYGMKMWGNRSYDYVPAVIGNNGGNFNNMDRTSHVLFFDSHDESRIAEHALNQGLSNATYNVRDPLIMYERVKQAAAFLFLNPGPKMLWQFDELGYDIDINFNGRIGNKPLPWGPDGLGYYENPLRKYIYDAYSGILDVRKQIGPEQLAVANTNHKTTGATRRLRYNTTDIDLVVIGNFSLEMGSIDPQFTQTGWWYDYFSGDSIDVANVTEPIDLKAGEWHIYTTERLSDGMPGVVEVYDNPVTISPYPFSKSNEITITFDATKAFPNGTAGLVGAQKVYMHSGVVLADPNSTTFENVVGTFLDDGIGEMTEVSDDIWEIVLTPKEYYSLANDEDPFKIGMYFRDENNINLGMGFRDEPVYFRVQGEGPIVAVEPMGYLPDTEITITFDATKGNGELIGFDKVYMHSGVGFQDSNTPWNSAWQNVVGNWGQDDGVGEMSPVAGEPDKWEITLTPTTYYGITPDQFTHWISAVFRSADGNTKGTGTPGSYLFGIIHSDFDYFLENDLIINTEDLEQNNVRTIIQPNPATDLVNLSIEGITSSIQIQLIDITGKVLIQEISESNGSNFHNQQLNTQNLTPGMYVLKIVGDNYSGVLQLIKM